MSFESFRLVRRTLALAALLGTLSGALAPVCAAPVADQAPATHCGPSDAHDGPAHDGQSSAPAHHHDLMVCTAGVCVSVPFASTTSGTVEVLPSGTPFFTAAILASATPQHTTPPPRS